MSALPADGTVLVTGASRGIGRAAAEALLGAPGRHLIVTTHRPGPASGDPRVREVGCDLASLADVRDAAARIGGMLDGGELPPLCAIVANAGLQPLGAADRTTADGFELTFGTNVLGHYLLLRLLLDRLGAPGRILIMSSAVHFGDLRHNLFIVPAPRWRPVRELAYSHDTAPRSGQAAYATSKLALIYLTHELARRLPDGVDCYSFNPGFVPGTGMARDTGRIGQVIWRGLAALPFTRDIGRTGAAVAAAAVGPRPGPSGAYLDLGRPAPSSEESYHPERELELWTTAADLVGLSAR